MSHTLLTKDFDRYPVDHPDLPWNYGETEGTPEERKAAWEDVNVEKTWRVWHKDYDVNGDGFIPALQVSMPSVVKGVDAEAAARSTALGHPFEGKREFVCVEDKHVHPVTLRGTKRTVYEREED